MSMHRLASGLVALAVIGGAQVAYTQDKPFLRVTEEQGRAALAAAAQSANGNPVSLESNFQREIRKISSDYDNNAVEVYARAELNVSVMGPAELHVRMASAQMRRGEGIENVVWPNGITVYISPLTPDSPDIVDILVTRDGETVAPLQKELIGRSTAVTRGQGQGPARTVHEGAVVYPLEAFNPGAEVEVHAISDSGRKYSRKIYDRDLRKTQ